MRSFIRAVLIACIAVAAYSQNYAEYRQSASLRVQQNTNTDLANLPAQKLGRNDLVALSVYDFPEVSRTVRIGADGFIRLPMVKEPIKADGLMPGELEQAVAAELKTEQLIIDPVVTVTVVEYDSRPISVVGAVNAPTTFQATQPISLLDAIAKAGGLTDDAGLEILVTQSSRSSEEGRAALVRRIPVRDLIDASDPQLNIKLNGGEEVRVPTIGKVYVVGQVKKPGAYPVQDGADTTVLQMLALAEGLDGVFDKKAYIYRKTDSSGTKSEIAVPLRAILKRKSPDIVLTANDILYIPENANKKIALAALDRLLTFGSTAGASAIVYSQIR
jgi:Periplasmic protein involved in polysaccharide export